MSEVDEISKALRLLTRDSLGASKKRKHISAFLKKQGFISLRRGGAWLGFRNRDIVSGIVINGPRTDTYIETFVLPAFDRLDSVYLSLGDRIVHCSLDRDTQEECEQAFSYYLADISAVRSPIDLIEYVDARQVTGFYPIWVRYICYLRLLKLDTAIQYLDGSRRNQLHESFMERLEEISRFAIACDADAVVRVLDNWSAFSEKIFGPLDQTFSVF